MHMYIYIYISLSLSLYIYIYIYIYGGPGAPKQRRRLAEQVPCARVRASRFQRGMHNSTVTAALVRGNHLSNIDTTCLTQVFFKSGE